MAITEQQVFETAEKIHHDGFKPSALSIREILQTGSLGTIQKHLKVWRERGYTEVAPTIDVPDSVRGATTKWIDQIWTIALHHSRQDANIKLREVETEKKTSEEDAAAAWQEVERLEDNERELREKQEEDAQKIKSSDEEIERLKNRILELEDSYSELSENHEKLKQENEELVKNSEVQSKKLERLQQDLYEMTFRRDHIQTALNSSKEKVIELGEKLDRCNEERTNMQSLHSENQAILKQKQIELDSRTAQLEELQKSRDEWQGECLMQKGRLGELEKRILENESIHSENVELKARVKILEEVVRAAKEDENAES